MVRERLVSTLGFLGAMLLAGALANRLAPPLAAALAAPQLSGTVTQQLAAAADAVDAAIAKGGTGLTFEVVQRNTLHAKPGGPQIALRAEDDRTKVVALVDDFYVNAMVSRGIVTGDAFWMFMRRGPAEGQAADFERSEPVFSVIERDGALWRNDGDGWYGTDGSPGMGMDPVSARRLPQLLRSLAGAASLEPALFDGRLLVGIRGTTTRDDYPGVVASDGKDFTDATFEVECWLDEGGRLVRLVAHARNLNQTTWDLVAETIVTFGYGATGDPPEPSPTMAPEPLPTSEPEAVQVQP